jgi:late competence protein required for DNA uptake (superfamily II DNA/RNA helicase)
MTECSRCKFSFTPPEVRTFPSGKSYCSSCIMWSSYKCEHCEKKFVIGNYSADYDEGQKLAWKDKLEHVKNYHNWSYNSNII